MKKALKLFAAPFMLVFQLAWAILASVFCFLWELVKLPFSLLRSSGAPKDGYDYEYRVAEYLRRRGYYGVSVTQASGDYGADVIARRGTKKYAVQCKYYSSPVGVAAVQEVVAAKAHYGCNAAMVVTNNMFTKAARDLADANSVILLEGVTGTGRSRKGRKTAMKEPKQKNEKQATPQQQTVASTPVIKADKEQIRTAICLFDPSLTDVDIDRIVQASNPDISLLQRACRIGSARAGRLMDNLEYQGLVQNNGTYYCWTKKALSQNRWESWQ